MSPRWNWDSPTPLAASACALPPPVPKGGGGHQPGCSGGGGAQIQRPHARGVAGGGPHTIPTTGETLSTLPTLWIRWSGKKTSHASVPLKGHTSKRSIDLFLKNPNPYDPKGQDIRVRKNFKYICDDSL